MNALAIARDPVAAVGPHLVHVASAVEVRTAAGDVALAVAGEDAVSTGIPLEPVVPTSWNLAGKTAWRRASRTERGKSGRRCTRSPRNSSRQGVGRGHAAQLQPVTRQEPGRLVRALKVIRLVRFAHRLRGRRRSRLRGEGARRLRRWRPTQRRQRPPRGTRKHGDNHAGNGPRRLALALVSQTLVGC